MKGNSFDELPGWLCRICKGWRNTSGCGETDVQTSLKRSKCYIYICKALTPQMSTLPYIVEILCLLVVKKLWKFLEDICQTLDSDLQMANAMEVLNLHLGRV